MKRTLKWCIIIVTSALLFCCATALADRSGTCGANLNWTLDNQDKLVISGTGNMTEYMDVGPWGTEIKQAIIEDGVTSIGSQAFFGCGSLTDITIPDSVTSIGNLAFGNCSSLTDITIPEGVTSIGNWTFSNCSSLTGITIPEGVTSIGSNAFRFCGGLTSVTIPESVTSIGDNAFYSCRSLTDITIPEGVTSINNWTFYGCASLTDITIPEGVTSIGDDAFQECRKLACVELPSSMKNIDQMAFSGCTALTDVNYHGTEEQRAAIAVGIDNETLVNATWHYCHAVVIDDGISQGKIMADPVNAFENEVVTLVATPDEGYDLESLTVMHGEMSIPLTDNQFVMPNGEVAVYATFKPEIIAIGPCGAEGDNITWALDSQGLLVISGTGAMADYTANTAPFKKTDLPISINRVVVEPGVTHIGAYTFYSSVINGIELPAGLTSFGEYAFSQCSDLTEMEIPEGVTELPERMFVNCTALQRVTLPSSLTRIGSNAFLFCFLLTDVTLPENLEEIGEGAFNQCFALAEIVIPSSVSTIGKTAFRACRSLTSVSLPYGITMIGEMTFDSCRELISVEIPETVTRINYQAFSNCVSLTAIEIPSSVNVIGNGVFKGCTGLTGVEIPSGVTRINANTFKGCTGLTSIVVPDGVTSIDSEAFSDCTELTRVEIPSGLETIDQKAFFGCTALEEVYYHGTPEQRSAVDVGDDNEALDGVTWHYSHPIVIDVDSTLGMIVADHETAFENEIVALTIMPNEGCVLESLAVMQGETAIAPTGDQFTMPDGEVTVHATFAPGGLYGNNLHWLLRGDGTLVIDGAGEMHGAATDCVDGEYITCAPWGAYASQIQTIIIGDGVTRIGNQTFYGCRDLTGITIPDSVTSIGNSAFRSCSSLTGITIPDGVTRIDDGVFYNCSSLASVTIPNSVTSIGENAFPMQRETLFVKCNSFAHTWAKQNGYESKIANPDLPYGYISTDHQNPVVEPAVVPTCTETGLTEGSRCLVCDEIVVRQETIPALGHEWGEVTYNWSGDNSRVTASRTCKHDPEHVETDTVTAVRTLGKAPTDTEMGETLFTAEFANEVFGDATNTVADIPALNDLSLLRLPAMLKEMEDEAFMGLAVEGIIIPDGCTTIGSKAFADCPNLIYIKIPASVTSIADDVFEGSNQVRIDRT